MKRQLSLASLFLCAAILVATLFMLLRSRFDTGDVYPPYSTLRADPLGAMAFYESLQRLPGISTQRDFQAANRLPAGRDTTYVQLAADAPLWRELPEESLKTIERFMIEGGRVVVMLLPQTSGHFMEQAPPSGQKKPQGANEKDRGDEQDGQVLLSKRWELEFGFQAFESKDSSGAEPALAKNVSGLALPPELPWHSGTLLQNLGSSWQVIYSRDAKPVMAERRFGQGSIVFATDSYLASNEAMVDGRQPQLLAWLVGPNRDVVFDEAHFGIVEPPGIAALARKYRLHGVVAALLSLAGLFVWRNAVSFAPSPAATHRNEDVLGRDSAAGFVSLLRRHIKPERLLDVCIAEWRKTFTQGERFSIRDKLAMEAMAREEHSKATRERDLLERYRRISSALSHRNRRSFRV